MSEDELGCDEDELPPLPGELADAIDELFEGLDVEETGFHGDWITWDLGSLGC